MSDPLRVRTFELYYGEGFRPKEILLDFMVEQGTIKQSKGWYEWEGSKYRKEDITPKLDDSMIDAMYDKLGIK
jgi:transposase